MPPNNSSRLRTSILFLIFTAWPSAHAYRLDDVQILDLNFDEQSEIQFKLKSRTAKADSFFYLAFEKSNRKSMDQLAYMLQKLFKPDVYRVDLDIPSFSPYPPGSIYTTNDVRFLGKLQREPNGVKKPRRLVK